MFLALSLAACAAGGPMAPAEATFTTSERRITGLYSYWADASVFRECGSEARIPVAQEADNLALEAAYLEARGEPGEELLIEVEGRIEERPRMEGEGTQPALIVERFLRIRPGDDCPEEVSMADVENTRWELVKLGADPVDVGPGRIVPHLRLVPEGPGVDGHGGCNRVFGGYQLDGEALSFPRLATTRRYCVEGMELEEAFLQALESTERWRMNGERLELLDDLGVRVATFEATTETE